MADAATVLIVDDDPLVRATFVRILERGGFQLREAEDGQQGLTDSGGSGPTVCCSTCACRASTAWTC